jgi:hypothetical protein
MRRVLVALIAVLAFGTVVGHAAAGLDQDYLYWDKSPGPTDIAGVRSSIGVPGSGIVLTNGDWFITSVWALNGASSPSTTRGIQEGVIDLSSTGSIDPGHGNCNSHTGQKFFFTEIDDHNTYSCYYEGTATQGTNVEQVKRDSSGTWWGYLNGVKQTNTSISWTSCGGFACFISAFTEESIDTTGTWTGKFSGSGNTDWSFYNGTIWSVINNYSGPQHTYSGSTDPWTDNFNSFPDGLWTMTYNQ